MGHGAVGAGALHRDLELVARRHHGPGADGDLPRRHARPVVHAVDGLGREALEQPFLHHGLATAEAFLGGLEDEIDRAGKVAGLGQVSRRTQQHRRVPIMAAGVHGAVVGRAVGDVVPFEDRQRVHVGAERDGALARRAFQDAHHAGLREPAMHRNAEGLEFLGHDGCGALLLETQFRMSVDIAPPRRHIVVDRGNAVDDGHGGSLPVSDRKVQGKGAARRNAPTRRPVSPCGYYSAASAGTGRFMPISVIRSCV